MLIGISAPDSPSLLILSWYTLPLGKTEQLNAVLVGINYSKIWQIIKEGYYETLW